MIRFDKKAFEKLQSFETIKDVYEYSTERYAERTQSRTSDGVLSYTYGSFRKTCEELSEMLDAYGIGTGDKVAILSGNTPNWSIAFFTIASFGRTAVPILPESSENEVANILSHSETRAVFVSRKLLPKIGKAEGMLVIDIEESLVVQRKGRLVALVLLKDTLKDRLHLSSKEHERLKQEIMDFVNRHVSRFSRITDVEFVKEAFEKTATHKIRRMKYCQA